MNARRCAAVLAVTVSLLCSQAHAETDALTRCRTAAGFAGDDHYHSAPSADAISLCERVAEGSPRGAAYLARALYLAGRGPESLRWIQQAVAADLPIGHALLGIAYQYGYGLDADPSAAMNHYRRAAASGQVNGQYNLASYLMREDRQKAAWHEIIPAVRSAASVQYAPALNRMAWLIQRGVTGFPKGSAPVDLYAKAADLGNHLAMYNWAILSLHTRTPDALKSLQAAAESGNCEARILLADLHRYGRTLPKDLTRALQLVQPCISESPHATWSFWALTLQGARPGIDLQQAEEGLAQATEEMASMLRRRGGVAPHYWLKDTEPSAKEELFYEIAYVGDPIATFSRKAAASLRAHEIARRLGLASTLEVLADLSSHGYPATVRNGTRQLARELQLDVVASLEKTVAGTARSAADHGASATASPLSAAAKAAIPSTAEMPPASQLVLELQSPHSATWQLRLVQLQQLDMVSAEPIIQALLASRTRRADTVLMRLATTRLVNLPTSLYHSALTQADGDLRALAVHAAANNGIDLNDRILTHLVNDKEEEVRLNTFHYAPAAGWVLPANVLIEALKSTSKKTVEVALRAAAGSTDSRVHLQLLTMLGSGYGQSAADSIRGAQIETAVPGFVRSLGDPQTEEKRNGVLDTVRKLPPSAMAQVIDAMLSSPEAAVRRRALWIVDESGSQLHYERIVDLARSDSIAENRRAAVSVLLDSWNPDRISTMDAATRDPSPRVRALALEGLAQDHSLEMRRAAELALDSDSHVRYRAARLLKGQGIDPASPLVRRLLADPHADVREVFRAGYTPAEVSADLASWNALPGPARVAQVCRQSFDGKAHSLQVLLDIADDRAQPAGVRARALDCAYYRGADGLTEKQIASIDAIIRDPTTDSVLGRHAAALLQQVINPSAARAVMRHVFTGNLSCSVEMRMDGFPDLARNEAARDYLVVPSLAVQQRTLECMGKRGGFVKYLQGALKTRGTVLTTAEVDALTRMGEQETAQLLRNLLPAKVEPGSKLALLQGFWEGASDEAHTHAMAYRGELPAIDGTFGAWAKAIASNPSQATLDRLLLELGRAYEMRDEAWHAAFTMSAKLPSARLDLERILPLASRMAARVYGWERVETDHIASPLAFLVQCLSTPDHKANGDASDHANNERTRVLPVQTDAIRLAFTQCESWRKKRGLAYPKAFQGIAKRLLLSAGRREEALVLGASVNDAATEAPLLALAHAELDVQAGRHTDALDLLKQIEQLGLPRVAAKDGAKGFYLRLSWLRGEALVALGREQEAISWLQLASVKGGRTSTGIRATASLISLGVSPKYSTARWIAEEFDMRDQSGPQVYAAVATIMGHLVNVEAEKANVEQSLVDADRLGALYVAGIRAVPLSLADKEKQSALRQLLELEKSVADAQSHGEKEIAIASQRKQAWLADLRMRFPAMAGFLRPQPLRLEDVRTALGSDRALVQYVVLPSRSYVWVISRSFQKVLPVAMGSRELYRAVATVKSGIVEGSTSSPTYLAAQRQLYNNLVAPVLASTDALHWVIVPHAAIHDLPFAALRADGEKPLIQRITLSLAPSTSAVANLRTPAPPDGDSRLLAIGGATPFDGVTTLPRAVDEVETISRLVPGKNSVKVEAAATRELLLSPPSAEQSLHLALHGQARPGVQSRLVFANGVLTVRDIWGLPLRGTPRVVLSACESGLGEALTGNEILSLANAFQIAGAESVVSTLWQIRDENTAMLMTDFYTAVAKGRTTAQALAEAQRNAISANWAPDRWAGFTALGW